MKAGRTPAEALRCECLGHFLLAPGFNCAIAVAHSRRRAGCCLGAGWNQVFLQRQTVDFLFSLSSSFHFLGGERGFILFFIHPFAAILVPPDSPIHECQRHSSSRPALPVFQFELSLTSFLSLNHRPHVGSYYPPSFSTRFTLHNLLRFNG